MTPDSYTTVEPLRTWNWYDGLMSPYLPVAFEEISWIGSASAPPLGDTMAGVVALRVEPSAAASVSAGTAGEGVVGLLGDLLHATAVASKPAAVQIITFRIIR
jgi:hypothetical protein